MHQNAASSQYPSEDTAPSADVFPASAASAPEANGEFAGSASHQIERRTFASPGLTPGKRYGTAIMLFVLGLFVVWVVWYQGGSVIVSAILGFLLIAGFIWYLRMIAPTPFTLELTPEGLARQEQGHAAQVIAWDKITRVKEEQFANGKIIGVMIYARSTHSVYRALVLWRDDLPQFDEFRQALNASTLPGTRWQLETVHE